MRNYLLGLLGLISIIFTESVIAEVDRVICIGGAISEWVIALDSEDKLVGVDTTSLFPRRLAKLPKVGYQRQLSAEGVASLKPNLILGSSEMGPEIVLAQIKSLGISVVTLSTEADLKAVEYNLATMGSLLDKTQQAKRLFTNYQITLDRLVMQVKRAQEYQPKPKVLLVVGFSAQLLAAGKGTSGDWLIKQAGGINVVDFGSYKVISNETLMALNPDVIIVANTGKMSDEGLIADLIKANPSLSLTKALQQKRLVMLDASLLVAGLGPRMPDEVKRLITVFYPLPNQAVSKL